MHAIREYGKAIKQMAAANIFPGDLLFKNFGVTRFGRVVFYDYDEIAYMTDCTFRRMPAPRTPEDELSAEPWYPVGANDVFPEEFAAFLLGDPRVRKVTQRKIGITNSRQSTLQDRWRKSPIIVTSCLHTSLGQRLGLLGVPLRPLRFTPFKQFL